MDGTPKEILARGQQKSIQTDRVILIQSTDELQVVREIFEASHKRNEPKYRLLNRSMIAAAD